MRVVAEAVLLMKQNRNSSEFFVLGVKIQIILLIFFWGEILQFFNKNKLSAGKNEKRKKKKEKTPSPVHNYTIPPDAHGQGTRLWTSLD
jgi:hypothetical protein